MRRPEGAARRVNVRLRCAFCLLLISTSSCSRSHSTPAIRLDTTNPSHAYIEVTGLPRADLINLSRANLTAEEWSALLHVALRSSASSHGDAPAMAGHYTVDGSLRFWPSFPFDPGREYDAYMLRVEPILEDLAGNRIGRGFEVLSRRAAAPAESSVPVLVPFIVR